MPEPQIDYDVIKGIGSMKVAILFMESGSYETFDYEILGVFSTVEKAKDFAQLSQDSSKERPYFSSYGFIPQLEWKFAQNVHRANMNEFLDNEYIIREFELDAMQQSLRKRD